MRICYADPVTRAIADLVPPDELTPWWTVTRINVPARYRGRGHGSALLDLLCAEADREQITLALEPQSAGGLDGDALIDWYRRRGFRRTRLCVGYLLRRPR